MSFNHHPTKQAQEGFFSRKATKKIHPKTFFNNIRVSRADSQKHLGLHLYSKLSFDIDIKTTITIVNRTIGLLRNFQQVLPRPSLITIYKAFIRHLGDVIFDQAFNNFFHQRLESIQYNAALAITEAIRGTSKEKSIRNLVSRFCNPEDGFENYLCFIKLKKKKTNSKAINFIFYSQL